MLADTLHMQVSAEKKRELIFLKKGNHLFVVVHGALGGIHPALGQQIMVGNGYHKHSLLLCPGQLFIGPGHGAVFQSSLHLVIRLILAGVQHQKPVSVIQGVDIAQ